jgi:hypothetical protein
MVYQLFHRLGTDTDLDRPDPILDPTNDEDQTRSGYKYQCSGSGSTSLYISNSVPDPDPDPHVFGPPGSESISQNYGSF